MTDEKIKNEQEFVFSDELHKAFETILADGSFSDCVTDIIELVYCKKLNRHTLLAIIREYKIKDIADIKEELLNLLIAYINIVLKDNIITDDELRNLKILKLYFRVKEGDFYKKCYKGVENILHQQFEILYSDNKITSEEEKHDLRLQELFDLSYDQFDEFKENEIRKVLLRGANITELNTARFPKKYNQPK
jgi:hypothetical protein